MADTSVSYQCPNCNAPLAYEPGEEKVTCAYCGTEFAVSDLEAFYAAKEEPVSYTHLTLPTIRLV